MFSEGSVVVCLVWGPGVPQTAGCACDTYKASAVEGATGEQQHSAAWQTHFKETSFLPSHRKREEEDEWRSSRAALGFVLIQHSCCVCVQSPLWSQWIISLLAINALCLKRVHVSGLESLRGSSWAHRDSDNPPTHISVTESTDKTAFQSL